jgi:hypothetical protein
MKTQYQAIISNEVSKKELKKYVSGLNKPQLEAQIIDLYERFKEVKELYDFTFNPNEKKLMDECRFKISKEYFPVNGRRPKARRSVAQNHIRHFIKLGVEPTLIADIMVYHIEVGQAFSQERRNLKEAFFKSMLKSFQELLQYQYDSGLMSIFNVRNEKIVELAINDNWMNYRGFEEVFEKFEVKSSQ